jgi:DNA-directed RNA polymerase subunit M/transcription elongation factor TFIIS
MDRFLPVVENGGDGGAADGELASLLDDVAAVVGPPPAAAIARPTTTQQHKKTTRKPRKRQAKSRRKQTTVTPHHHTTVPVQVNTRLQNLRLLFGACGDDLCAAQEIEAAAFRDRSKSLVAYSRVVSVALMRGNAGSSAATRRAHVLRETDALHASPIDVHALTPHVEDLIFGDGTGAALLECPKCGGEVQEFSEQLRRGDEDPNTVYACQATGCRLRADGRGTPPAPLHAIQRPSVSSVSS